MHLAPAHRVPLRLPKAWPACAQGLLREGAAWLHGGGPGGWGADLLAFQGGPRIEARWDGKVFKTEDGRSPWEALEQGAAALPLPWVGAATYELACWEGGLPFRPPSLGSLGMAWTGLRAALWVREGSAEAWGWEERPPDPKAIEARLAQACALRRPALGPLRPAWEEVDHRRAVSEIQELIGNGAFYVANLCVPFEAPFEGDPLTFALARMRAARPPFGAYLPLPGTTLLCLGMERLLARGPGRLWAEPIKGSAPLTGEADRDVRRGEELRRDPKERAEHTMILDLIRNDLGRVARTGSVRVADFLALRAYPTVQHLVSTVEAEPRAGVGLAELLRAALPGGSVTGAPKHAVCAHLARTEAAPRGFYCGALGWIGPGGAAFDLALPIRTAQLLPGRLVYWAGGGITRRSEAPKEWEELWLKARILEAP